MYKNNYVFEKFPWNMDTNVTCLCVCVCVCVLAYSDEGVEEKGHWPAFWVIWANHASPGWKEVFLEDLTQSPQSSYHHGRSWTTAMRKIDLSASPTVRRILILELKK